VSQILHIHLLGDFRLDYDDVPVTTINTPRLQPLLAYLVLHRDAPRPRPALVRHKLKRILDNSGKFFYNPSS
jgi:hypothetical protein